MYTCDHCREQLWDDLFGLLEPGDSENLHQHILGCDDCRVEMEIARAEHQLVAAAARLDVDIPAFSVPSVIDAEPVLDAPRRQPTLPSRRFRVMPWLVAAAALLMIGLPIGLYQYGRLRYQAAWRAAENRLAEIVKQRDQLHSQAKGEREDVIQAALANHLRLQAVGSAAYQVGAAGSYHVWVSDVEGHPIDTPVTARLLDAGKPVVLETQRATAKGEWLVNLPAHLPLTSKSTPCLELLARTQADAAPLRAYLRVLEPAYRTCLTIDKPVYEAGDTIHFRSLTLKRFGHKVPDREFTAIYTLTDARGKELQTLRGLTRKDGIGGGDFAFSPNSPAGEYTLTVAEAENRFPPATTRLRLGPVAPAEPKAPQAERLEVEFFPESGDLIADVENRVYFRVRNSLGEPADLRGVIIDSQGREVVAVQTTQTAGLGIFTLRPRVGENYRLQVISPRAVAIHARFPPTRTTGLSLSLPNAVGGPHEPFRAIIQHSGPYRNLIVVLFCQGRVVAQDLVTAKTGITEARLTPTISCSGVFWITVYGERQGQLWPLAERLAYRRPEKQLKISVRFDKESYAPGETVRLNVRTLDELGKPEPSWLLLSVVNQAALPGDTRHSDGSAPAYFQLTSELPQPEELEQADILLRDSPEAATALDLFLGTQGWRRFEDGKADTALVMAKNGTIWRVRDLAIPAIMKLDNRTEIERRFATSLSQTFANWQDTLTQRDHELVRKAAEQLQDSRRAAQELDAYEQRAGGLLRLAGGVGGVVVFAAGCLLLGAALWRLMRGLGGSRGYLAGSFAALSLCVVILWGQAPGGGEQSSSNKLAKLADFAAKLEKRFDVAALVLPTNRNTAPSQALSKAAGLLPQAASAAGDAALVGSNAQQGQQPPSILPTRQPWIGILRAAPSSEQRTSSPPIQNSIAPALPLRVFAYDPSRQPAWSRTIPSTVFWQPILFAQNGTADVSFALPAKAAIYRIRAQGHADAGRLGMVEERLECRPKK
jgi:hypothetical protein